MTTKSGKPVTDAVLDEWAESFERGEWPEGKTVVIGRPSLADEEVKVVTFRLPVSKIVELDRKAAQQGISRSQGLREAVEEYLLRA
ncbi:MAG: ribbon-helix-helix domain-containing protein [Propionibacteriaceae bacterium]|nr:ribbon-helix-helix domain-containing protein [Propionibacteriaceae bacterium]